MKRIAMIKDGVVANISMWDMESKWIPPAEYTLYDITNVAGVEIGDEYNYVTKEIIKKDESSAVIGTAPVEMAEVIVEEGLPV